MIKITCLSDPYIGVELEDPPIAILNSLALREWDWRVDYSEATEEESSLWLHKELAVRGGSFGKACADEDLVLAGLRACARQKGKKVESDQERIEGTVFVYLNLILADEPKFWARGKGWKDSLLPRCTLDLVGPRLREIVEYLADTLRKAGWRLGLDATVGNHFLQAINKDGRVVVYGWGAVHGPKEYERKLIELLDISEADKTELLAQL